LSVATNPRSKAFRAHAVAHRTTQVRRDARRGGVAIHRMLSRRRATRWETKPTAEPTIRSHRVQDRPVAFRAPLEAPPMTCKYATNWDCWGTGRTTRALPTDQKVGGSNPSERANWPEPRLGGGPCRQRLTAPRSRAAVSEPLCRSEHRLVHRFWRQLRSHRSLGSRFHLGVKSTSPEVPDGRVAGAL
jgi:hypothetical protein